MPDQVRERQGQPENTLEALFEAANRDPALKRRLLENPQQVANEYKVKLNDQEVEQLTKLGVLVELADDVKFGRLYQRIDPRIFYPVSVWKVREVIDIIGHLIPHVGYPGPEISSIGSRVTMGRLRARIPNPIFYPADDFGGGSGGWGGGGSWGTIINPGVIFYPAELLSRLEAVLVARLRTAQKIQE